MYQGWNDGGSAGAISALNTVSYYDSVLKQMGPDQDRWFASELQESLSTSTHDVQMILNYVQTQKDLDGGHIGMYGQGSGGAIGILAAAADSRIAALQLVDPWGDWPDWLKRSKQIPEDERVKRNFCRKWRTSIQCSISRS